MMEPDTGEAADVLSCNDGGCWIRLLCRKLNKHARKNIETNTNDPPINAATMYRRLSSLSSPIPPVEIFAPFAIASLGRCCTPLVVEMGFLPIYRKIAEFH